MLQALRKWASDLALEAHLLRMAYAASDCSEDGWYEGRDIGTLEAYGRALGMWLQWKLLAIVCRRKGHQLQDDSADANWQDGEVYVVCTRCGQAWHGYWG